MTIHKVLKPRDDVDRLNGKWKWGGRIEDYIESANKCSEQ